MKPKKIIRIEFKTLNFKNDNVENSIADYVVL